MFLLQTMLALAASAQAPGTPSSVIRTESRLVLVDAVVTDRHGNYVTDLTAKDFHVWDDNREQTVRDAAFAARRAAESDARSYLVLFFDNTTLDPNAQRHAREEAAAFIGASAGPNRLMAVVNYGGGLEITQNFTSDAERLKRVVADAKTAVARAQNQDRPGTSPLVDYGSISMLVALRTLAANLASVPGRKSVVLFTSDVPMTPEVTVPLASAINFCNRSNIAVYTTDVAGLNPSNPSGSARPVSSNPNAAKMRQLGAGGPDVSTPDRQILDALAGKTGGFVFTNSNDLKSGLAKIANELSQYYLVSYVPSESPEGSCHALRVKVDLAGATVRARASYCNVKAVDLLAGKPIERSLEDLLAGDRAGNLTASIAVPYFYSETDTARLHAALEIPANSLHFEKIKGKSHAEANVMGIAYRPDGTVGARFSDTVKLDFATQKELDDFHRQPLAYEKQFFAAPGKYQLKVVFSSGGESFARLETPLDIPPYDGKQFMLSGLALSRELHPAAELGTAQDSELLEGRTPLIFNDLRIVPLGGNRFRRSDTAAVYLEVYGAAAPVEVHTRVVDRATGEVKSNAVSRPESTGGMLPVGLKLNLSGLAAGPYRVDVEAVESTGKSLIRSADFEVE